MLGRTVEALSSQSAKRKKTLIETDLTAFTPLANPFIEMQLYPALPDSGGKSRCWRGGQQQYRRVIP
jgi:hypothetical protein